MLSLEETRGWLKTHGQEHLLRFWDQLNADRRELLLEDIASLDFVKIRSLHALAEAPATPAGEEITPMRGRGFDSLPVSERAVLSNTGHRLLRDGKVAALLVAGGQGTRLGFDGPKGAFDIGLPSGKSLFQLQGERLRNLSQRCGRPIPCSPRGNYPCWIFREKSCWRKNTAWPWVRMETAVASPR
jgi:UDP-N-acetylglucosamine pyrophosphorylase